ncbi:GNAT family N-acetyltransferase [Roseibacterium sp. SDUM158016]|uniref:GNAT family N-acetyltransferase n=1 Tax=Roseicyclus sediminis TaxID=2980997 RepID=UPI0021CF8FFD|nr:N-acetyltransferase [Roseibacterium sp. SDUM158016]MCU4651454.1 GNAT family N-acetyltransferase [Roseibacterium sp. SDUM158016]
MTDGVRIRAAVPGDAGAVARMLAALADELGYAGRFASTEATIATYGHGERPLFATFIAEAETPVGFALSFPHFSTMRALPGVYVQDLWTAPEVRGQGLGAALLAEVAEVAARDWNAAYMALSVHAHNAAANRFYAGLGFGEVPDERAMVLDGPGFAALADPRRFIP